MRTNINKLLMFVLEGGNGGRSGTCTKKRGQNSVYICSLRSSTTYAAKYLSKAHAHSVSVLALLLAAFFESVEVSKMQEYQRNAFPICSRCTH